ncbi:MAG: PHP domain-containing protein [Lachnospiraceae bacterium]
MEKRIDLHVHSTYSDGTLTPTELVTLAVKRNLCAFALTDHDTTDGLPEAIIAARTKQIELISGIELSCNYHGKEIHIVGLGIEYEHISFVDTLSEFKTLRDCRNKKMIKKLQDAKIDISYEQMFSTFGNIIWTRAHFAKYLQTHGYVAQMWDAFPRYIGDGAPCFVPKENITPYQVIKLIHENNGYAILAHPLLYHYTTSELDTLVYELSKLGIDGLEAIYSSNHYMDESNMKLLAHKYHLKISGGSDYHGANKPNIQLGTGKGNVNIPYYIWKDLCS